MRSVGVKVTVDVQPGCFPAAELARVVREVREDPYLASYPDVRVDSRVHTAVCAKDDPGHAEALERRYHPMLLAAEMCLNAR